MRCLHYSREAKAKPELCRLSQQIPNKPYADSALLCDTQKFSAFITETFCFYLYIEVDILFTIRFMSRCNMILFLDQHKQ